MQALLRRATEMQAAEQHREQQGLSLEEVQQVAKEIGIEPHFVVAALAEQAQVAPAPSFGETLVGGSTKVHRARTVPVVTTQEAAMHMIALARKAFGSAGTTSQLGKTLDWTHRPHPNREAHLTITPDDDHTTLSVSYRFPDKVGGAFAGVMSLGVVFGILLGPLIGLGVGVGLFLMMASVLTAYAVARMIYGMVYERQVEKVETLMDALEAQLQQLAPPASVAAPTPPVTLEQEAEEEAAASPLRRRDRA